MSAARIGALTTADPVPDDIEVSVCAWRLDVTVHRKDEMVSGHFILKVVDLAVGCRYRRRDGCGRGLTVSEAGHVAKQIGEDGGGGEPGAACAGIVTRQVVTTWHLPCTPLAGPWHSEATIL